MSSPPIPFKGGSVVYEPYLGLCRIESSFQETILGLEQLFFQLQACRGNSVIKVPAGQMVSRGIRDLMTPEQIELALESQEPVTPQEVVENSQQRLRRWISLVRSEQNSAGYQFLREWQQLALQGVNFNSQENEMREKVYRGLTQEIAQVLEISPGKATSRLNRWLEPVKAPKEKKR